MRKHYLGLVTGVMALTCRAIGGVFNSMASLCDSALARQAGSIPLEPGIADLLTFRDVVQWVTENRPSDAHVVRAVLLREKYKGVLKVVTVFLGSENNLVVGSNGTPHGRAQRVHQLDEELSDFFGSRA